MILLRARKDRSGWGVHLRLPIEQKGFCWVDGPQCLSDALKSRSHVVLVLEREAVHTEMTNGLVEVQTLETTSGKTGGQIEDQALEMMGVLQIEDQALETTGVQIAGQAFETTGGQTCGQDCGQAFERSGVQTEGQEVGWTNLEQLVAPRCGTSFEESSPCAVVGELFVCLSRVLIKSCCFGQMGLFCALNRVGVKKEGENGGGGGSFYND